MESNYTPLSIYILILELLCNMKLVISTRLSFEVVINLQFEVNLQNWIVLLLLTYSYKNPARLKILIRKTSYVVLILSTRHPTQQMMLEIIWIEAAIRKYLANKIS